MKTVKINHVILTLALSDVIAQTVGGNTRDEIDKMINDRLAEGYDEVQVIPLKTNFDERQQPTHVVNEYIFRAYEKNVGFGSVLPSEYVEALGVETKKRGRPAKETE